MYSFYANEQLANDRINSLLEDAKYNQYTAADAGQPTFAQRFLSYLKKLWQRNADLNTVPAQRRAEVG